MDATKQERNLDITINQRLIHRCKNRNEMLSQN